MAGALDFLTVQGPRPASYTPPAIDSSWAGKLVDDYQQGQQYGRLRNLQTMFQPGTPGGNALASGNYAALLPLLAGAQGAEGVSQMLPALMQGQKSQQLMQGEGGDQQSALPTGGTDPRGMLPTVIDAAKQNGIDPNRFIALTRGEGLADYHGDYENGKPTSFGATQLHFGGRSKGLGDEYFAETGKDPRDPANEKDMIYWSARKARETGWGPWSAARKMGWGRFDGIGQPPATASATPQRSDQLNPANRAAVDRMYPPSTSPGTPQETQQGPTPGTAAAESAPVGNAAIGQQPAVTQPAGATGQAPFMAPSGQGTNAAGPGNITGGAQKAAQAPAQPQAAAQAPAQQTAQAATPAPADDREIAMRTQRAQNLRATQQQQELKAKQAAAPPYPDKDLSERFQKSADDYGARAQKDEDFVAERQKQQFGVGIEGQKKALELNLARSDKLKGGIEAASRQFEGGDRDALQLARSALNDPAMWTGAGAERSLDLNRIRAIWGDTKAAQLQEMLQKVTAQSVLSDINSQRDQMMEAGGTSTRLFSQQADLVKQTSAQLGSSLAGNRALVEIKLRNGELASKIAQMERDYLKSHAYLDSDFDQKLSEMKPLYSPNELAHPALLGVPTAPATLQSSADYTNWGQSLGLKPGDPFRTAKGTLKPLP
jgi:hypothetical protein